MIIDSPIISGSYAASGSLNQLGNVVISGSLTVTGSIIGTASFATTASYLSGYVSPFPFTGSAIISGSLEVTGSANIPNITGSLLGTASFANTATSSSFATTASFSLNVPITSSYANNATSASFAATASYLTGYISPFPYTGSAIISGSLEITGSASISNLSGSGVRYLVADSSGSVTAQSASAALKSTQAFTSTAGQTTFSVTNGYATGYVDVFINGSKLSTAEFTDTSGTNIVLATGSFSGDTVEVVKYTPAAGVTNNVLRQLTTFTASAGQTVFSASYTPGLLDIFYNGSRLSTSDYTANNGTYFTLATASAADDILDVLVYSYQVGAFNGIGGVGTAAQVAYFDTTNSITGSPNFTISGSTMTVTGSLIVSGSGTFTNIGPAVFSGSLTSTAGFTGSFSGTATSASYAANADLLDGLNSTVFATTGSNTFAGIQTINSNLVVTGSITAQTLVVQTITSSVDFVTGSTRFGSIVGNTHQFTGSVGISGSLSGTSATFSTEVTSAGSQGRFGGWAIGDGYQGNALEVGVSGGTATLLGYNRTSGTYIPLVIGANTNQTTEIGGNIIVLQNNGVERIRIASGNLEFKGVSTTTNFQAVFYNANDQFAINATNTGTGKIINFNPSNTFTALSLAANGAATFSSSVTANSLGVGNNTSGFGDVMLISNTNVNVYPRVNRSSTSYEAGWKLSTGGTDSWYLGLRSADGVGSYHFYSYTTSTSVVSITNGGNVLMGTTADVTGKRLNISGAWKATITSGGANASDRCEIGDTNGGQIDFVSYVAGGEAYSNSIGMFVNGGKDALIMAANANIRFVTSGYTERMRIANGGNVGIGTVVPNARLDLGSSYGASGEKFLIYNDDSASALAGTKMGFYIDRFSESNSVAFVFPQAGGTTSRYHIAYKSTSGTTIADVCYVNYNSTSWTFPSDERMKNVEGIIPNALDKIKDLRPVYYTQKRDPEQKRKVGLLAQDLLEVLPEVVDVPDTELDSDGNQRYMSVALADTIPLLVKAIQEQQTLITALQEKLERNNIN